MHKTLHFLVEKLNNFLRRGLCLIPHTSPQWEGGDTPAHTLSRHSTPHGLFGELTLWEQERDE